MPSMITCEVPDVASCCVIYPRSASCLIDAPLRKCLVWYYLCMNLKQRVREVLWRTRLMSLGTCNEAGVWVADLFFVFDDSFNIYWMSHPETRHSKSIHIDGDVAGTITVTHEGGEPNLGIQFEGRAEKINGARYDLAVKHYAKSGRAAPSESEDVLGERSWYTLRPTKINLIDGENFGFNVQNVEL